MRHFKILAASMGAALLVAACGGGGGSAGDQTPKIKFSSMVTFGDSLSDVGSYKVGTVATLGGGQWTVNSPSAKNWTELLAAQYSLPAPCAAETGLPSVLFTGFTGDVIKDFPNCRNYAQGSARVTSSYSLYSLAVQQAVLSTSGTAAATATAGLGLMAVPVATQMSRHLANVGGSYSGSELVTVLAGANDVLMNLNAVAKSVGGGATAVGAATFAGWTTRPDWGTLQTTLFLGGTSPAATLAAATAAQNAAVDSMGSIATDLAGDIQTQVIAKGAKYVVVVNVPDISITPFATETEAVSPGTVTLLAKLVNTFNTTLTSALNTTNGVIIVDAFSDSHNQSIHPEHYALSNVTKEACDPASTANPLQGRALTCTASSTLPGIDTSAYLFADGVHPTPYGYKLLAQLVAKSLVLAGWL